MTNLNTRLLEEKIESLEEDVLERDRKVAELETKIEDLLELSKKLDAEGFDLLKKLSKRIFECAKLEAVIESARDELAHYIAEKVPDDMQGLEESKEACPSLFEKEKS